MEEILTWLAKEFVQHVLLLAPWLIVSAVFAGGGYVLGALIFGRRYKQRIATLEAQVQELKKPEADLGYEVLTWWGETGSILDDASIAARLRKRFPRTIRDRRTGQVYEVPNPVEHKGQS